MLLSLAKSVLEPISRFMNAEYVELRTSSYKARYASEIVRGMARPHRPLLHRSISPALCKVRTTQAELRDWLRFVNKLPADVLAPLTFYNGAGAICLFQIFSQLRINFSTILHLRSEVEIMPEQEAIPADHVYGAEMVLVDVIVRKKQCILVIASKVHDEAGRVVRAHKDYWFVKKCDPKFMESLAYPGTHSGEDFQGLSLRCPRWSTWDQKETIVREHFLRPNAGQIYGHISGDYNVIHTTHWGARLCGQDRPFLQGFGILNLCLHHATQVLGRVPDSLSVTFARPALVDQKLRFYFGPNGFEVCDEEGKLVAFGRIVKQKTAAAGEKIV